MTQDKRVSEMIRELADSMKAEFEEHESALALIREKHGTPVDVEAALAAKYRDKPLPPLSAEMRAKLGAGIPRIEE